MFDARKMRKGCKKKLPESVEMYNLLWSSLKKYLSEIMFISSALSVLLYWIFSSLGFRCFWVAAVI